MTKIKLTYEELEARLAEIEDITTALRNEEVGAMTGERDALLLRLEKMGRELHDNERLLYSLITLAPVGIFQTDVQGNVVYVNKAFYSLTGLPAKNNEVAGWMISLHPKDRERVQKLWTDSITGNATFETEFRFTGKGKDVTWVKSQLSKLKDDTQNVVGYIGTLTNITDLKQAEWLLSETNNRNRTILNTAIEGFWRMDKKGYLLEANKSYCRMSGYSKQELLSMHLSELDVVETPEDIAAHIQKVSVQGSDIFESRHRRKDGTIYDVKISVQYQPFDGGCFIVFLRDISERKDASKERESLAKFPSENPNPVLRITRDGEILYSNAAGKLLLSKWQTDIGKTVPEKWCNLITKAFTFGNVQEEEEEEEDRIFSITITPVQEAGYANLYAQDITERKKAEKEKIQLHLQLRQTQKMEAIGTLAGGIAHDFNNILGALIGYAVLAKEDVPEGTVAHQNLEEVLVAAARATKLVTQILVFGRKDEAKLIPMQIDTVVAEALKMLRSSLPTTIVINQDINCNSLIMADETQIHQVLLNLGTNAAHAMKENGGILEVNLTDVNIDSDNITRYGNLQQGSYVKLSVKDTGCGMSKEIQDRMFEPFYTTKEVGKGTGLGLSVVHGILEIHNGVITVDSKQGEGTTFNMFFPRVDGREIKETEDSQVASGQGERILYVDDEKSLVEMATQMLTRIGYEVIGKTNSTEALDVFQEDPGKFDLVITDLVMPNMNGTELAGKLLSIRPEIPIILCTGFSGNIDAESVEAVGIKKLFVKPVNRNELNKMIREILDKKGVTA